MNRLLIALVAAIGHLSGSPAVANETGHSTYTTTTKNKPASLDAQYICQMALEDIKWSETIWPESNTAPKPERRDVLSDAKVRERVEDNYRMENALAARYGIHVSTAQLQHELDRIARTTRAPEKLMQRFQALDMSPQAIADCVVRPVLVERSLRQQMENDADLQEKNRTLIRAGLEEKDFKAWWSEERTRWLPMPEKRNLSGLFVPAIADESQSAKAATPDTWRIEQDHVPAARRMHTAVWTGAEMIVWGGEIKTVVIDPETDLEKTVYVVTNTGGRYDPAINVWTASTNTTEAPSARWRHTAVWTGTEMVVWGGDNREAGNRMNSGGRYDPTTDTWTGSTSTTNAPTARLDHSAVWTGSEMIVWGGQDTSGLTRTGKRYDPSTDTWGAAINEVDAPAIISGHSAVWTGSLMLVFGRSSTCCVPNAGKAYNPVTDSWIGGMSMANSPNRLGQSAIWDGADMIVWGGSDGLSMNDGWRYNLAANTWSGPISWPDAPQGREEHSAVWTGEEMIIWGGGDPVFGDAEGEGSLTTGGRYNSATNSWGEQTATTVPASRKGHSAVWTGTNMIVWGGNQRRTGQRYDPVTNSWLGPTSTTGAPSARNYHSAVWTGSEMIVWGGRNGSGSLKTGGRYDPINDTWGTPTSVPPTGMLNARSFHTAIWTGVEMIVWGGVVEEFPNFGATNTGARFEPTSNTWTAATPTLNAPAGGHTAVWTGSEMIVWGGGSTGGRFNPTMNIWTGATSTTGAPQGGHAAVWTGTAMIVWGGGAPETRGIGAYYDPNADAWVASTSTVDAPALSDFTAVWTGEEMLLWGGDILTATGLETFNDVALYTPLAALPQQPQIFTNGFEED